LEHVGKTSIWKNELPVASFASYLVRLFPDRQRLAPDFLVRWMNLPESQIRFRDQATPGVHQVNINPTNLRKTPIAFPSSLPEQRKIASILTTVDSLIEQTEALIEKYRRVKQGMMADLLSRGVDSDGKLRPTQQQAPELYKQSELGWIPKDWEVTPMGAILEDIDAGWSPECIEKTPPLGEWGVLKVSAVSGGEYRAYESKTLPDHLVPRPEIEVRNGDVILTRSNGVAELVGLTVFVEDTRSRLMLSDKIMRLWPATGRVTNRFLALAMQAVSTRRQILQWISGSSGQRNISQLEVRRLTTILPSVREQSAIVSTLQASTNNLRKEIDVVAKLRTLKTGLMQDLLTGKVRVQVDEAEEVAADV
jgi:type I restriction enzyme S subunit